MVNQRAAEAGLLVLSLVRGEIERESMIFTYTHAWLTGVSPHTGQPKTQTRRLPKPEYFYRYHADGQRFLAGINGIRGTISEVYTITASHARPVYRVGQTYAIQPGRGKKAVGRFLLTAIRVEELQAISEADAWAEGCRDIEHYRQLWDEIHYDDLCWQDNPKVIVLEIETIQPGLRK